MASAINGSGGLFQITSISCTKKVIALGETVPISMAIKNVSGKQLNVISIYVCGNYETSKSSSGTSSCGTGDLYILGSADRKAADIWYANVTRTFSFDYNFSEGEYSVNSGAYVISKTFLMSIYLYDTSKSSYAYDTFDDISSGLFSVLYKFDNLSSLFTLERAYNGSPNDEGESVITSLALSGESANIDSHGYTASISCSPTVSDCALNVGISDMLAGIYNSSSAITGTFSNSQNYTVTITVSNGYESQPLTATLSKAFANVHMSGASTGGVCFGGFSSATEKNPKFECNYPAYFNESTHFNSSVYGSDGSELGSVKYSTSPVKVGTWINGNDVYQVTFRDTYIDAGTNMPIEFDGSTNAIIDFSGSIERVVSNSYDTSVPVGYYSSSSSYFKVWYDFEDNCIYVKCNAGGTFYLTVRYTKR